MLSGPSELEIQIARQYRTATEIPRINFLFLNIFRRLCNIWNSRFLFLAGTDSSVQREKEVNAIVRIGTENRSARSSTSGPLDHSGRNPRRRRAGASGWKTRGVRSKIDFPAAGLSPVVLCQPGLEFLVSSSRTS